MKFQQNHSFWLVPNKKSGRLVLAPGESAEFDVVECFDGTFDYNVWVFCSTDRDIGMRMDLNYQTVYSNMKIRAGSGPDWTLFGNFQLVKGEHHLVFYNNEPREIVLDAIVVTHFSQYVQDGTAEAHRKRILAGEDPEEILEKSGLTSGTGETEQEKQHRLDRLYKMGFLERRDQKTSTGNARNGVPMGGIGAGKVELDPDGLFTGVTINNNCEVPVYKTEGSFFAVYCSDAEAKIAKVLRRKNYENTDFPRIDGISYTGKFPTAHLDYVDEALPVRLSLDAFSSLIPNDVKNSSLPGVMFRFTAENLREAPVETAILFSWENMINVGGSMAIQSQNPEDPSLKIMNTWNPGFTWSDRTGNYQEKLESDTAAGLLYFGSDDKKNPSSFGDYTVCCRKSGVGETIGICRCWNIFREGQTLWQDFAEDGCVSGDRNLPADEENAHTAGAVSRKITIAPGEKVQFDFVLSWNMPVYLDADLKDMGVYYSNFFHSSRETAEYLLENQDILYEKTTEVHRLLERSSLPKWVSTKLLNDMFPIYSCSWFSRAGKFAINESPTGMMGCLGTMDQRLACNVIYTNFFPELDKTELSIFAQNQGSDGSIGHDVGFGKFISGERKGTWPDLCASFVLQIYKFYCYTGDRTFLDEMYPRIKRAVAFQISIDQDQNGIPDVGSGHGTTYDTYHWYGTCSFVASLWLCELKICMKLAELFKDLQFRQLCSGLYEKAQKSMISELWNEHYDFGGYFNNYNDSLHGKKSENCFIAQLAGQWFAQLMDLGYILPEKMVREALSTVTKRNLEINRIALMSDETTPEGDPGWFRYTFVQYDEVYFGCLAIYNDLIREGMKAFRKVYNASEKAPWMTALTYFTDGSMGGLPYYMTNPASFFLLEALSGYLPDVAGRKLKLSPHTGGAELHTPLFSPALWLWLDYEPAQASLVFRLEVIKKCRENAGFDHFVMETDRKIRKILVNGKKAPFMQTGRTVEFRYPFGMEPGETYQIELSTL